VSRHGEPGDAGRAYRICDQGLEEMTGGPPGLDNSSPVSGVHKCLCPNPS
jgi:hypothetical protein